MGHKIARAYGYATHVKPQGFISRPPLLTTNKVFVKALLRARTEAYRHVNLAQPTVGRLAWPLCMFTYTTIL